MHPYMIAKVAASRREDLLSPAERHRRLVQVRRNHTAIGRLSAQVVARIAAAVPKCIHAATHRLKTAQ